MKKDSNMFNDNSTETEGVPADKTAEIPKVEDSTDASSPASRSARLVQESSVRRFSSAAVDMPSHMRIGRAKRTPLRCPSQRTMRSRTWCFPLR